MLTIAVDAMGGDHCPKAEVSGAILATKSYNVRVILVGREDVVRRVEQHHGWDPDRIQIHHASEQIGWMERCEGRPDQEGLVDPRRFTPGARRRRTWYGFGREYGAVMATAKMVQGVVPGVGRPALAQVFPSLKNTPVVVVDVGANVDCEPKMLAQFAVMGDIYSRVIFGNTNPRVGLLSIGEEESKGNELTKAATPLLKKIHSLNFIGNVEGRDLYTGHADVIVCDGFIGNVALKVSEGIVMSSSRCSRIRCRPR